VVLAEQGKSREHLFLRFAATALGLMLSLSGQALAQSCNIPERLNELQADRPANERAVTGTVGGYTLALSWSPEFCRGNPQDTSEQCSDMNKFGFIVHGLWPEGASGSQPPRWCRASSVIDRDVFRAQFCTMPSSRLMAHQWAKHGSCAARNPGDYFAASRKLFASVRTPDMNAISRRNLDVGGFKRILSALNPRIQPSHMVVITDRRGDWFEELRICLSREFRPEPCRRDRPRGAPDGAKLKIWRG
jgi:ribonuclease T2